MPSANTCPINSLVITTNTPSAIYYKKGPSLGDNLFVYFSLKTAKRALVEFRLSEDSVCYENDKTNISKGRVDSIFLNEQRQRCDEDKQDSRFIPIVILHFLLIFIMGFMILNCFSIPMVSKIFSITTIYHDKKSLKPSAVIHSNGNYSLNLSHLSEDTVNHNTKTF